ncbi:MAG: phosphoribosylanthranilate isomerase [Euryarchaeota archaeon]|nr:phosphoribosylanthranilate isomerase [Euryarchaeota archaeon]
MVKVKICGVTTSADAKSAIDAGADYIGMIVEVPVQSPRKISLQKAKLIASQINFNIIAVIMPKTPDDAIKIANELNPFALQLHGKETLRNVKILRNSLPNTMLIKTLPVSNSVSSSDLIKTAARYIDSGVDAILLDTYVGNKPGGTGQTHNWEISREVRRALSIPVILAGGLTPENVAKAVKIVKPFAVDVASGVERFPGQKDPNKMKYFVKAAKGAKK